MPNVLSLSKPFWNLGLKRVFGFWMEHPTKHLYHLRQKET
jgi:hypothetical protein